MESTFCLPQLVVSGWAAFEHLFEPKYRRVDSYWWAESINATRRKSWMTMKQYYYYRWLAFSPWGNSEFCVYTDPESPQANLLASFVNPVYKKYKVDSSVFVCLVFSECGDPRPALHRLFNHRAPESVESQWLPETGWFRYSVLPRVFRLVLLRRARFSAPCCKKWFPLSDAAPGAILPFESGFFAERKVRTGEEIPVVITASEGRLGAAVTAMNSINRNSKANVVFSVVTLNESVEHLRWATTFIATAITLVQSVSNV